MKHIFITGASGGIGRETVKAFAREGGMRISAAGFRSGDALFSLKKELEGSGTPSEIYIGDIAEETFVRDTCQRARERFGTVDILVNNAGIDWYGLLQDMAASEWDRVLSVNLRSVFLTCREVIPQMLEKHAGTILNVSSVWGRVGAACEVAYAASKGGINALTRSLAKELAPSGIRVNAAAFGMIDTSMNDIFSAEEKKAIAEEIPLGRSASPAEAADLIVSLALRHPYLTGQIVTLDGGWT